VATIETGQSSVNELALTQNGSYVLGTSPAGVVVIHAASRQVTSVIPAAGASGIAIPASGNEAYVVQNSQNLLSVIDTRMLSVVGTLGVPGFARRIAVNTSGRLAIVTLSGGGANLIDLAGRTIVGTADVAPGVWGVTFANGPRRNQWKPLYAFQAAITAGGTGYVAREGAGTLPLAELPGGRIAGTAVVVGYACNGDVLTNDPDGKIAIIERGPYPIGCAFSEKFANVVAAGAIAGIVYNDTRPDGGYENLVTMATGPVPIPGAFVRRSTGLELAAGAPLQVTMTTCGESMSCRGVLLDWLNW
jgi:DNA-binding beta-propeller fold protein YncE